MLLVLVWPLPSWSWSPQHFNALSSSKSPTVTASAVNRCLNHLQLGIFKRKVPPLFSPASIHEKLLAIEDFWRAEFAKRGLPFEDLRYQLYSREIQSDGILIKREFGPVYHRLERTLYIDPDWFIDAATVIGPISEIGLITILAHEFGHHVQALLNVPLKSANWVKDIYPNDLEAAVKLVTSKIEDQADCLSGIYLHTQVIKNPAYDFTNSLKAILEISLRAVMLGDDIQSLRLGQTFNAATSDHGTGESRLTAVLRGMAFADISQCEPFPFPVLTASPQ